MYDVYQVLPELPLAACVRWWEVGVGGVHLPVGREGSSLLWNLLAGVCQAVSVRTSSASQANETGFR